MALPASLPTCFPTHPSYSCPEIGCRGRRLLAMLVCTAVMVLLTSSCALAGGVGDAGLGVARVDGSAAAAAAASSSALFSNSSSGSGDGGGGLDSPFSSLGLGSLQRLWAAPNQRAARPKAEVLAELREENAWKNSLVTWMLPQAVLERMPFVVQVRQPCGQPPSLPWHASAICAGCLPPAVATAQPSVLCPGAAHSACRMLCHQTPSPWPPPPNRPGSAAG